MHHAFLCMPINDNNTNLVNICQVLFTGLLHASMHVQK
ncbi:hypothetical protein [Plasmodium yoelii yoelii]|uniref:Uncharacterized protein n=1 Tax=Plasmodium yoelii yoelii TaxID=73239 RepID=Q7RDR6_PLAYO|nr:hypothetical protein [Plasmodium yoelii yoelii]